MLGVSQGVVSQGEWTAVSGFMHLQILSHSHNDDCILWRQTAFWGTSLYIIT